MNKQDIYKSHCINLRKVNKAITLVESSLKNSMSMQQKEEVISYTRILSFLITCWTEVRILKVTYEVNAFDGEEIKEIIEAKTLSDKWIRALNIAICRITGINYISDCNEIAKQMQFTNSSKYIAIINLIEQQLKPSIEIRNRIAHGQWERAFKNDLSDFSQDITAELHKENYIQLECKLEIFKDIAYMVNDLCVSTSKNAFFKDFDKYYKKIDNNIKKLDDITKKGSKKYTDYENRMIRKYLIGKEKKSSNRINNHTTS